MILTNLLKVLRLQNKIKNMKEICNHILLSICVLPEELPVISEIQKYTQPKSEAFTVNNRVIAQAKCQRPLKILKIMIFLL